MQKIQLTQPPVSPSKLNLFMIEYWFDIATINFKYKYRFLQPKSFIVISIPLFDIFVLVRYTSPCYLFSSSLPLLWSSTFKTISDWQQQNDLHSLNSLSPQQILETALIFNLSFENRYDLIRIAHNYYNSIFTKHI